MNKYQALTFGSLGLGVLVLIIYFVVTRVPEEPRQSYSTSSDQEFDLGELENSIDVGVAGEDEQPAESLDKADSVASGGSSSTVKLDGSWIEGWWSEGGFCEGDAGEGFRKDGSWNAWAREGEWSIAGNRLTIRELVRTFDTASGGPEPIDPPVERSGIIQNPRVGSFDFQVGGKKIQMVKCE